MPADNDDLPSGETENAASSATQPASDESESGDEDDNADDSTGAEEETGDEGPVDTGGGDANFCAFECDADGDCLAMGTDLGLTCQDNRCVGEAVEGCTDDEFCIAQLSGWNAGQACASQAECDDLLQSCIEVEGAGHCVISPSDFFACADAMMEEVDLPNIDGDTVTVCGNTSAECREDGTCFSPCGSDDDCFEFAPSCDIDTGTCLCTSDADCETIGADAQSTCLEAGFCGCGSDDDCTVDGGDTCTSVGVCGCSGDAACEGVMNPYDGTTVVCG